MQSRLARDGMARSSGSSHEMSKRRRRSLTLLNRRDVSLSRHDTRGFQRGGMQRSILGQSRSSFSTAVLLAGLSFFALRVHAQSWESLANESTLEVLTVDQNAQEHWSKFWLVVIDGQLYLRLGRRGAARIEGN